MIDTVKTLSRKCVRTLSQEVCKLIKFGLGYFYNLTLSL